MKNSLNPNMLIKVKARKRTNSQTSRQKVNEFGSHTSYTSNESYIH